MSFDRREAILNRLYQLMQNEVEGIENVYRNQPEISGHQRPAIVVMDGDEVGAVGAFALGRPSATPSIVSMTPEIYISVAGGSETVGSDLNDHRLSVIAAVLSDQTIKDLVGQTGGVQYQGCFTDLGRGRLLQGEMGVTIAFHYPLLTSELL